MSAKRWYEFAHKVYRAQLNGRLQYDSAEKMLQVVPRSIRENAYRSIPLLKVSGQNYPYVWRKVSRQNRFEQIKENAK